MQGVDLKKRVREVFARLPAKMKKWPILLAVSSGRDSSVLASVVLELRTQLPSVHFIHVNYHLRVPDSDREEKFLRDWAKREGVSCHVKRLFPRKKPANLQSWAREKRLHFFFEIAQKISRGQATLWTAHHRADQAETVLERILRGAGLKGIAAMEELEALQRIGDQGLKTPLMLVRPFLSVPSEALSVYARYHQIPFHLDRSNATDLYRRNRIRRRLLPALARENPNIEETLCTLSRHSRQAYQTIEEMAQDWLRLHFQKRIPRRIALRELQALSPGLTAVILEKLLQKVVAQALPLSKILPRIHLYLAKPQGKLNITLPQAWQLRLSPQYLQLTQRTK